MSNSEVWIFFSILATAIVCVFALIAVCVARQYRAAAEAKRVEAALHERAPEMVEAFPALFKAASLAASVFADDDSLKHMLSYSRFYFQQATNSLRLGNKGEAYMMISYAQIQLSHIDGKVAALRTNRDSDALLGVSGIPILLPPLPDYEKIVFG